MRACRGESCPERAIPSPSRESRDIPVPYDSSTFVYILRCADGTCYVGHAADLAARERQHNDGTAAQYPAVRRPVTLVYSEEIPSTTAAIRRERQIKHCSGQKKAALVAGDLTRLDTLGRRRGRR